MMNQNSQLIEKSKDKRSNQLGKLFGFDIGIGGFGGGGRSAFR